MCVSWLILLWFKDEYRGRWVVKILPFDRCFEPDKPVSAVTTGKDFVLFPVISIRGMGDKVIFEVAVGTFFCRINECVQDIAKAASTILFILITGRNLNILCKDTQRKVNRIP